MENTLIWLQEMEDNNESWVNISSVITMLKKEQKEAINYTHCCETSIDDFQINDKITFKQHRSGIVTDVYINELQVKDVNGNYKTIGKNDVIEKH